MQLDLPLCQRWRRQRDSYRPASEPIDPRRYGVEVVEQREARPFVEATHYSGSYPAARLAVGLHEVGVGLVGVAVFSVPPTQAVIPRWTGQAPAHGVELGRLVLLDRVPGNGESWFLGRAFEALAAELPEVRAVLAYSDPVARETADGRRVKPGHVGVIYQAHNGRHVGRGKRRVLLLDRDGRVVSERMLSKLRNEERGQDYAAESLARLGAPPRCPGESGESYYRRALPHLGLRRLSHPGNLAYVWPLGDRRQRRPVVAGLPEALPYPRLDGAQPRSAA